MTSHKKISIMKKPLGKRVATTQVSPSGMAAASQAVPGEFDSRHLLQKEKTHPNGAFFFLEIARKLTRAEGGAVLREQNALPTRLSIT